MQGCHIVCSRYANQPSWHASQKLPTVQTGSGVCKSQRCAKQGPLGVPGLG